MEEKSSYTKTAHPQTTNMKRQYIYPIAEVTTIEMNACLMDNSITQATGTAHEIEIQKESVDHADSRSTIWDD